MIVDGRAVASSSRQRRSRLPGIRCRVVDIVQSRVGTVRHHVIGKTTTPLRWLAVVSDLVGNAPADDMDSPIQDNSSDMVTGRGQRRGLAPFSRGGVIDFVRSHSYIVESAPADR